MKLLYYCNTSLGGLADYSHEQAKAISNLGIEVIFLCSRKYVHRDRANYQIVPILRDIIPDYPIQSKIKKALHYTTTLLYNFNTLGRYIKQQKFKYVLMGSYVEYLAPLWSGKLQYLAQQGVIIGAIAHDPVRDFVVGPLWWHRYSIACGYSFLRVVFLHDHLAKLDTVRVNPELKVITIPHGSYQFTQPNQSSLTTRQELQIPADAKVMLAFGQIRDNKNLDLIIKSLTYFPELYLIIAGAGQSGSQKPVTFYQELADSLGVNYQCRWLIKYLSDQEVANLFNTTDLLILTYSNTFKSASGVMNTAASFKKFCLVSSGEGSLKSVMLKYQLGIWIEPDNLDAIITGITTWLNNPSPINWELYLLENSWSINAKMVIDAMGVK